MHPIPSPQILDPDRPLANDRGGFSTADDDNSRAELLDTALRATCAYAKQLWENLDAVRTYLLDSLPPDPRSPGPHPHACASPTGPDDEQGWQNWIAAYASVTSVLCGPQGDSGFGLHEARNAAEERRTAPILNLYARHPELEHGDAPAAAAGMHSDRGLGIRTDAQSTAPDPSASSRGDGAIRPALTAVVLLLALRGLRPRRRRTP